MSLETVRVRPTMFEDAEAIGRIHQRNGMEPIDPASWRARRESYPFAQEFRDLPIGWVLETEGELVGSLANIHLLYELGGQRLKAGIAASWAVDSAYRGKSLLLNTAFYRQKGLDLWLNVTANPTTAQLLTAMRVPRIPIPDYGTPCFWAVRRGAFAKAALVRKSVRGAALLAMPAGLALLARDIYRRSGKGRIVSKVRRLAEFDDRFDGLWQTLSAGVKRLTAVRGRDVLEWRYGSECRAGRAVILAAEQQANLLGYAVLARREDSDLGMKLFNVADLQAVGDSPETLTDLLLASIRAAREEGVDAVKFMSGTPSKRSVADALQPYTYTLPFWQQYFKAAPDLSQQLSTADAWDFSLFDTF